ncbi:5-oxoprolinase subunit PxpA [Pseudozobellia thermophila]|uniref:UPF0271 protein n=1 Tax=Pseudozobellia thermophila TaxID=192903 RepID=A0A1M6N5J1_9FLAO|nr:5-oxoprolinase subunit PxpA [Pseudozobellia thermophila]SHJ90954.1 UPF0271 protein [Pseudozobellia thermophila]
MKTIEINCDVGEGTKGEERLFPYITSCSIACGGHTGDRDSMRRALLLAKRHGVRVGAHPSYPDRANFGRKSLALAAPELQKSIVQQVCELQAVAAEEDMRLDHIKPHGALYNDMAANQDLAAVVLSGLADFKKSLRILVPFASKIEAEALKQGFAIAYEVFADRNYNPDLSLVARNEPGALILSPEKVLEHITGIIKFQQVKTISGELRKIKADTFCVHGDTPAAYEIVSYIRQHIPNPNT